METVQHIFLGADGVERVIRPAPAAPLPSWAEKDKYRAGTGVGVWSRADSEAALRRIQARREGRDPSPADLPAPKVNLAEDTGPFSRARMQAAYDKRVAARQAPASATEMAEAYLARRAAQS